LATAGLFAGVFLSPDSFFSALGLVIAAAPLLTLVSFTLPFAEAAGDVIALATLETLEICFTFLRREEPETGCALLRQHFLYFLPDPQGQGSFLPIRIFLPFIWAQRQNTAKNTPFMATLHFKTRSKLHKKLESACRKALFDFDMIEDDQPIGIALSGGKDSLTLLYLLKAISGRGFPKFPIHAFHVSGAFSCGPGITKPFLEEFCKNLNVPLHIAHAHQKLEELECYSCSRRRRTLLFDMTKKEGIKTLAFGHHRDDSVQTLLMNVLHKAEFEMLSPKLKMHRYECTIIRPLILIEERSIVTFSQNEGFSRITCQCPVGVNSVRKKTEMLLQKVEAVFPNARTNLAQAGLHYSKKLGGTYDD